MFLSVKMAVELILGGRGINYTPVKKSDFRSHFSNKDYKKEIEVTCQCAGGFCFYVMGCVLTYHVNLSYRRTKMSAHRMEEITNENCTFCYPETL